VLVYAGLLVDGYTGAFTWVLGFPHVTGPDRTLLPDHRLQPDLTQLVWAAVLVGLAVAGAAAARRRTASTP
jgi:hypothetical protein